MSVGLQQLRDRKGGKPDDHGRSNAEKAGQSRPRGAEIALAQMIGWPRDHVAADPAGAMAVLKERLPAKGRLRKQSDRLAIKACTWLFERIPDDHPRRAELQEWLHGAVARSR